MHYILLSPDVHAKFVVRTGPSGVRVLAQIGRACGSVGSSAAAERACICRYEAVQRRQV